MSGARHNWEEGATLLTTLFIVMAMSAAAFGATGVLIQTVRVAKDMDAGQNLEWLARSAAVGGEAILRSRAGTETALLGKAVDLPLPSGIASLEFRDAGNCFNLNSMAIDREASDIDPRAFAAYQKFLVASGVTETDAEHLAATLADWIDADASSRNSGAESVTYMNRAVPHYAADRPLRVVGELRAVEGYDPDVVRLLSDHVCAHAPAQLSVINVNALDAGDATLLYALAPAWVEFNDIVAVIEGRPVGGWNSAADFMSNFSPPDGDATAEFNAVLESAPSRIEARFALADRVGPVVYRAAYERLGQGEWSLVSLGRDHGDE